MLLIVDSQNSDFIIQYLSLPIKKKKKNLVSFIAVFGCALCD